MRAFAIGLVVYTEFNWGKQHFIVINGHENKATMLNRYMYTFILIKNVFGILTYALIYIYIYIYKI